MRTADFFVKIIKVKRRRQIMREKLQERFIRYVKENTQSDASKTSTPTTAGQLELGRKLVQELQAIGLEDVNMDEFGYVMATLPATTNEDIPTIGFLAHIDTATDFTGENVQPQIIKNYDGGDIRSEERRVGKECRFLCTQNDE